MSYRQITTSHNFITKKLVSQHKIKFHRNFLEGLLGSGDSRPDQQGGPSREQHDYCCMAVEFQGGSGGATPRSCRIFAI